MDHLTTPQIIEAFGGLGKLARRLDVPKSTVASWKRSGVIPRWRLKEIEAAAKSDGLEIGALGGG